MKPFQMQSYYELLEVPVSATTEQIRSAYARLSSMYADDQVALYGLVDSSNAAALRARLAEALEILADDDLRGMYDNDLGLPPRKKRSTDEDDDTPSAQLAMNDLLTGADRALQSTHPYVPFSYVSAPAAAEPASPPVMMTPPSPPPSAPRSVSATVLGDAPQPPPLPARGEGRGEGESAQAVSSPAASPPRPSAPPPSAIAAPQPSAPQPSAPQPPPPQPSAPQPRPSPAQAPQMAESSAIAEAESRLAQVSQAAAAARDPRASAPRPKPPEVPPDAEFNGELLRKIRTSMGLTLQQIAEKTRVSARHLESIEADKYAALPVGVYLRGILMTLSRELQLDGLRVAKSYLALVEKAKG